MYVCVMWQGSCAVVMIHQDKPQFSLLGLVFSWSVQRGPPLTVSVVVGVPLLYVP